MREESDDPKKAKREKIVIVLIGLALTVSIGTYWETHRAVTHGDAKDRPKLRMTSVHGSKQDDHFLNVLVEIRNEGELGARLDEISSRPLTGSIKNNPENQVCYNELRDAKPFPNPGGEDRNEILKGQPPRPVVLLIEMPAHCDDKVDVLLGEVTLNYRDPFGNVYEGSEPLKVTIGK